MTSASRERAPGAKLTVAILSSKLTTALSTPDGLAMSFWM